MLALWGKNMKEQPWFNDLKYFKEWWKTILK